MMSIRRKMALWMSLAVFAVTSAFCGITYFLGRDMLVENFTRSALQQFSSVANAVKVWTDGDVYVELNSTLMTGFSAGGDRAYVVRNIVDRELIEQSVSLDAADITMAGLSGANNITPVFGIGEAPNGADALIITQIMPAQWGWDLDDPEMQATASVRNTQIEITLALDRTSLQNELRGLGVVTLLIAIVSAIAAGGAAFITVKTVLRPLENLTNRAAKIQEPSYERPFSTHVPEELRPIAERLNDLLARLADASLVERRFTADAAHELRTPIAELRTLTDVALRFPTAPEQLENVIRSSNELSVRLTSLIDALLGIARHEGLTNGVQTEAVNVPDLIREIIEDTVECVSARGLMMDVSVPQEHKIMTDRTLLQSILTNLIGNAVSHAPDGAEIDIRYDVSEHGSKFVVINPAPFLTQTDLPKLFEPFWRKDGHRSRDHHSGLGLALCKSFVDILSFDLDAQILPSGKLAMTLTLPQPTYL